MFDAIANVARRKALPDHIGEISGAVIEHVHANSRIMGAGEKGIAGPEAGTDNREILKALLLKPVEAAARIDDRLPGGIDGAADVRRNGIVGAGQRLRHARVVIRKTETECGEPKTLQTRAECVLLRKF